jgi:8-oxo-dGTP diphosphatase
MDSVTWPVHRIVLGALIRDGQVLLCHRRADRSWYPDCWYLVGGHLEPGEDPAETLVRECREELGIEVTRLEEWFRLRDAEVDGWCYIVSEWSGEPSNTAPEEHDQIAWVRPEELSGLRLADAFYLPALTTLLSP